MIENKINELFDTIKNSKEYKAYLNIGEVLENNSEINDLVDEIKKLQKESVKLEEIGDSKYIEIDKIIEEKVNKLNSIPVYQEYLRRMDEFNNIITESKDNIEKFINKKIED